MQQTYAVTITTNYTDDREEQTEYDGQLFGGIQDVIEQHLSKPDVSSILVVIAKY